MPPRRSSRTFSNVETPVTPAMSQNQPQYNVRPSSSWSSENDQILINARAQGLNWQPIAQRYFPDKTPNACRKRHERLMERRHADDWDIDRIERLAFEYMEIRKDMWSMLASRLGERWQHVESKCMEKGIKNLTSAARNARRRGTGTDEVDSGIFMDETETDVDSGPIRGESSSSHWSGAGRGMGGGIHLPPLQPHHPSTLPPLQSGYYISTTSTSTGPSVASMLSPPTPQHPPF